MPVAQNSPNPLTLVKLILISQIPIIHKYILIIIILIVLILQLKGRSYYV